jgi:hypothetical protein
VEAAHSLGQQIEKAKAIVIGEIDVASIVASIVDVPDGA